MSKKGLGRGLEALLPEIEVSDEDKITEISVKDIETNPYQPRKRFDDEKITELAASIREYGILQPIIVRRHKKGYQLVAGERRYRAAIQIDLQTIPAVIRDIEDDRLMEIALIENLQREDLNPVEEAMAYGQLMQNLQMTQEQLSDRLGKSRSQIANYLRLLNLSENVINMLSEGKISVGHAKVLLSVLDPEAQRELAQRIVDEQLSVRQAEEIIQEDLDGPDVIKRQKRRDIPNELLAMEDLLKVKLGTLVKFTYNSGKGKIEIPFSDSEELQRILDCLMQDTPTEATEASGAGAKKFVV
jgi:ParB family transcriptional regulator, chromosome partitioning protein